MSRRAAALAVAVTAVGALAARSGRRGASALDVLRRRRGGLPRGVEEYPTRLVDHRHGGSGAHPPGRAVSTDEVAAEFYDSASRP